jgi:hypothetical protein
MSYFLAVLKIVGLLGAFAGLSSGEGTHTGKKSRWAFLFLMLAISAELVDSNMKIRDSREQAERFIRLSRPLGSIGTTIFYTISLDDPLVESYRKQVDRDDRVPPNRKTQPEAAALLERTPDITVFIYKAGRIVTNETDPDLSFEVHFPVQTIRSKMPEQAIDFSELARSRHYVYISEDEAKDDTKGFYLPRSITAQIHDKNVSDDRYSNQEIVSDHDILGATIQVRFCRDIFVDKADENLARKEETSLDKLIRFDGAYISFPGRQELPIMTADKKHVIETPPPGVGCTQLSFQVPTDEAEYKKLLLP